MSVVNVMISSVFVVCLATLPQGTPPPQTTPPPKPQTPPAPQTPPPPAPKPQTPPPTGTPAPPAKPPSKPPVSTSSRPAVMELSVTTMVGATIPGATVKAEGPTTRMGTTGPDGRLVFENLTAGTYRVRAEREGFVTLEKEITVFAGGRTPAQAVLSSAAPAAAAPAAAPPPPPPAPAAAAPVLKAGEPRVASLTDIAEQLLRETDPVAERALGCSGATASRLIRARDSVSIHTHADADELIYIVAGDATLKLGDKEQNISPGWFSMVPRGTAHSLTRRGRNPILILSAVSGPPCQ